MKWIEISVTVNNDAESIVSSVLQDFGSNGVAIEDSNEINHHHEDRFGEIFDLNPNDYPDEHTIIKGYFNEDQFNTAFKEHLESHLKSIPEVDTTVLKIQVNTMDETDWENEWKNYYHPFQASNRFFIVPSWELVDKTDDYLYIELDPGMAFGTGDHPTTSLCLKALETIVKPDDEVIDVGTGSGILSIASFLLGAQKIKAIDLDEMAIKVAKENFQINHCLDAIDTTTGHLLQNETAQYDVVIANILAHIIEEMITDAYKHTKENGYFITSGIIEEKEQNITSKMIEAGFKIHSVQHDNGWVCIIGQKVAS